MIRFVERLGEKYRIIEEDAAGGVWLISYDTPSEPFYATAEAISGYQRIETPNKYVGCVKEAALSQAQKNRLELIGPLLKSGDCIRNRQARRLIAKHIAEQKGTTVRRVLRIYYRYLATGILVSGKQRGSIKREDFDWAIRTFYYSAKKFSLKTTYDMLLIERYSDVDGRLMEDRPTWDSFRHYFYAQNYHKEPQKIIARDGLTHYLRNMRPAYGSASDWRKKIGSYQMDATLADIYLVSRFDRSAVVGRPYIYLAVDTATQLIAGVYVGMEAGEGAVMLCLAQAAEDKVAYCKKFGITIDGNEWPSKGLPYEVVADKGREFFGGRMMELCMRYGIDVQTLPPFRPDQKGLVEKAFDLLQTRYKPFLRGKGVIGPDAEERWSTDYRKQAVLDIDEFTQVILHCILYLNSGRVLRDGGETPATRWMRRDTGLLEVDAEAVRRMSFPRQNAKLTPKGFSVNRLTYAPDSMDGLYLGNTYEVAYDQMDVGQIYIILPQGYRPCRLVRQDADYQGAMLLEAAMLKSKCKEKEKVAKREEIEVSTATIQNITQIIERANAKTRQAGERGK